MALKVEVISKEIIKPSTPTPQHLKHLKLSLPDQYSASIPVSIIQFYSADTEKEKRLDHLKKSLSEVLTDFYPFAGRINGNQFIDCNDEGINFSVSQVTGLPLSHVVSQPEADHLTQLLPVDNFYVGIPQVLLSIQANLFECGGLAIAVHMPHKMGDASSLCLFVNYWAAVTRGDRKSKSDCPKFETASLFPPQDDAPPCLPFPQRNQKLVSQRFVFNACNISALKAKISDNLNTTRVQAVSALIWWCSMNVARKRRAAIISESCMVISVDLRGRMHPPVSNYWFGNFSILAPARENTENHPELHGLAGNLQEAIKKVDGEYATRLHTNTGFIAYVNETMEMLGKVFRGELEFYGVTSWCRFPFYEADFGWGKPIWVSYPNFFAKNIIALMDTKCGQGIEAWVTLEEQDMARFQCEPELIAYTSTSSGIN